MANTIGEKELKTNYPIEEGLEADQKHEGRQQHLIPEEQSLILERDRKGIY